MPDNIKDDDLSIPKRVTLPNPLVPPRQNTGMLDPNRAVSPIVAQAHDAIVEHMDRNKQGQGQEQEADPIREAIKKALPIEVQNINEAIKHVGEALKLIGLNWDADPSTVRTPERFVNYLLEYMQPYSLREILGSGFESVHDNTTIHGMIIQRDIPYYAVCEHHLLPFWGRAYIGYVPNKRIIGISKMARLVEAVGKKSPGLQEAHTEEIADAMHDGLDSKGSMVIIEATHTCMSCRGVRADARTITSCIRGIFRDVGTAREEFMALARGR